MKLEEKLYTYVTGMWYESKCKNKNELKKIIANEIQNNPDLEFDKLALKTLRRCKSEL